MAVYISYAGEDSNNKGIEVGVEKLISRLKNDYHVEVMHYKDKELFQMERRMKDAEEEIGKGEYIVVFLSMKYFYSPYCLYELHCIRTHTNDFKDHCFIIELPNVEFKHNANFYIKEIEKLRTELRFNRSNGKEPLNEIKTELVDKDWYKDDLEVLRDHIDNYVQKNYKQLVDNDFSTILNIILSAKEVKSVFNTPIYQYNYNIDCIDNIEEEERLWETFETLSPDLFKVININGMGGCGKSSFIGRFLRKKAEKFFNIIYVTVNEDVVNDIIDEILKVKTSDIYVKLKKIKKRLSDSNQKFNDMIVLLKDLNRHANQYNVLILDVDRNSKIEEVKNILNSLREHNFEKNWRVLIISRVFIGHNNYVINFQYQHKATNFLQNIFWKALDMDTKLFYLEADFEYEVLFEKLCHLPILVEKLACYLNGKDRKEGREIDEYIDNICDKRNENNKNIQDILDKILIPFSSIDDDTEKATNMQNVIRHIMLWPSDFYKTREIFQCLQRIFKDNFDVFQDSLCQLTNKRILERQPCQDNTYKYRMHRLIANTYREQVFNTTRIEYSDYIKGILECPSINDNMEKCVMMSICKYNIVENPVTIMQIAKQLQNDNKKRLYALALKKYYKIRESLKISHYVSIGNKIIDNLVKNMIIIEGGNVNIQNYNIQLPTYCIGKYEVTQGEWKEIMNSNNARYNIYGDDFPMESISWYDCIDFIIKLNEKTGLTFYLPTEAQWEFAAHGGNASNDTVYSGSNTIDDVAWYSENSRKTHKVGEYKNAKNEIGLYDMSGNVNEWCYDFYIESPTQENLTNPFEIDYGLCRVIKGGSYADDRSSCSIAFRDSKEPDETSATIGFRLALNSVPTYEKSEETLFNKLWYKIKQIWTT